MKEVLIFWGILLYLQMNTILGIQIAQSGLSKVCVKYKKSKAKYEENMRNY